MKHSFFYVVLSFIIFTHALQAEKPSESPSAETPFFYEFSLKEVMFTSQENFKYFFNEQRSNRTHYPALGKMLSFSYYFDHSQKLTVGFTLPTNVEVVQNTSDNTILEHFHFGKVLGFGYQKTWLTKSYHAAAIEFSSGLGLFSPLTQRFAGYIAPIINSTMNLVFSRQSGLTIDLGYGGTFKVGTIFIGLGVLYRVS